MKPAGTIEDVTFAWSPAIGGAVISVLVGRLSPETGPERFVAVGIEDGHPYLDRANGERFSLTTILEDDVAEAIELNVVMVREFADEARGGTREYRVDAHAHAAAPGL